MDAERSREFDTRALIESELLVRDLKIAIRAAIEQIDRRSYVRAKQELLQALDENPWPQRYRNRG